MIGSIKNSFGLIGYLPIYLLLLYEHIFITDDIVVVKIVLKNGSKFAELSYIQHRIL
jgi:hypothetical protein